ncbi:uncharacterized protein BXIN_1514 [Babesia sp. Xinjiang]|uniref:uncharacterized protein n=1 Tax=Babesia sp. Xinjiang TaxID=462227 RepID=UPI000A245B98|nr:uncharacterized protein BXIN_1514 [Babesia sp. Xinjiang]ORM42248.1 hypothetical protein BXIN_1514 [Babesia sp. Xinjiang]
MTISFSKTKTAICALAIITSVYPINSVTLDISKTEFPACIDIFEGTFKNGGVYRMFHSNGPPIAHVTYGKVLLGPLTNGKIPIRDIYVQHYKRGDRSIVAISHMNAIRKRVVTTRFYATNGTVCRTTNMDVKEEFVGNHILVPVNIYAEKVHPFIGAAYTDGQCQTKQWSVLSPRAKCNRHDDMGCIRFRMESVFISPVINIDQQFRDHNSPPPSLSSHSTTVQVAPEGDAVTTWIKNGSHRVSYLIKLPPTENAIFRPRQIIDPLHNLPKHVTPTSHILKHININVDISSIETNVPEIVILANLRRGDWLYTQYSFTPIIDLRYIRVKVLNSEHSCELYETDGEAFVTHVEVFDHVKSGLQYVVVNITTPGRDRVLIGPQFENIKRVYKRIYGEEGVVYFDINQVWLEPYLDMLYNIPIGPGVHKQDAHDIMMDTLLI